MRVSGLDIREMSHDEAKHVSGWKYPPPYDFYDMTADEDDLALWLSPDGDEGRYSVFDGESEDLIGFFSFGEDTRVPGGDYPADRLDIGLGLRPDLAGRGLGLEFFKAGLEFARRSFSPSRFRLSVAKFNERAITVYERAGFEETASFIQSTNGGRHHFIQMEREAGECA